MSSTALGRRVALRARRLLEAHGTEDVVTGITSERVRRATIEAIDQHQCDHYTRRPGLAALCRRVAQLLAADGVEVDPDREVIITGSLREARFVALRALAPGRQVYVPRTVPDSYRSTADLAAIIMEPFDLAAQLPPASADLLLLPHPDPETGHLIATEALSGLAAWAEAANLTVIADETATPLPRIHSTWRSFATWPAMASRTVIVGSFDTSGLGAWQVSWIAGPAPLVTAVRDLKQAMTICTPAASQYAALASLVQVERTQ